MKGIMKTMLAILCATSLSTFAATDNTPQDAFNDITRSLADLQPITFQAPAEKYKLLVFIDNQCIYCASGVQPIRSKACNKRWRDFYRITTPPQPAPI